MTTSPISRKFGYPLSDKIFSVVGTALFLVSLVC